MKKTLSRAEVREKLELLAHEDSMIFQSLDEGVEKLYRRVENMDSKPIQLISWNSYEDVVADFSKNTWTLKYLPERFITAEMCRQAVTENGRSLLSVPFSFLTKELCSLAVENGCPVRNVPKEFLTEEMISIDNCQ